MRKSMAVINTLVSAFPVIVFTYSLIWELFSIIITPSNVTIGIIGGTDISTISFIFQQISLPSLLLILYILTASGFNAVNLITAFRKKCSRMTTLLLPLWCILCLILLFLSPLNIVPSYLIMRKLSLFSLSQLPVIIIFGISILSGALTVISLFIDNAERKRENIYE